MAKLPKDLTAILPASFLAGLPLEEVEPILGSGYRVEQEAGRAFGARDEPVVALVLEGLVRVFLDSGAGREVTVRYARPGDALGLVHLLGTRTDVHLSAVTRTQMWVVRGPALLEALGRSTPLTLSVARECAARAADAMDELALAFFGSVKARLARHLLDLASSQPQSGALVAAVTQQQLADAIGSVREVVARSLAELRAAGVIAVTAGGIGILDAGALDQVSAERARVRAT